MCVCVCVCIVHMCVCVCVCVCVCLYIGANYTALDYAKEAAEVCAVCVFLYVCVCVYLYMLTWQEEGAREKGVANVLLMCC